MTNTTIETTLASDILPMVELATGSNPLQVRWEIASHPYIKNIIVFNQDLSIVYPDQSDFSFFPEQVLMANTTRLTSMLAHSNPSNWAYADASKQDLLYCNQTTTPFCVQLDTLVFSQYVGSSTEQVDSLVFTQDNNAFYPALAATCFAVLCCVALLIFTKHKHSSVQPRQNSDTKFSKWTINFQDGKATQEGVCVSLSAKDLAVIQFFLQHPETLITKQELYQAIYTREYVDTSRALDQLIFALRKKLRFTCDDASPIKTIHGRGYYFSS